MRLRCRSSLTIILLQTASSALIQATSTGSAPKCTANMQSDFNPQGSLSACGCGWRCARKSIAGSTASLRHGDYIFLHSPRSRDISSFGAPQRQQGLLSIPLAGAAGSDQSKGLNRPQLKHAQECDQAGLFFLGELELQHQVEKLHCVLQREQASVMVVRRRILDAA